MNDIEKAIEYLKIQKTRFPNSLKTFSGYVNLAISALEKQMPKRPIADDNGSVEYYECWIECPLCGEIIPEYTSENETECYCLGCGQKLDWSGDDE